MQLVENVCEFPVSLNMFDQLSVEESTFESEDILNPIEVEDKMNEECPTLIDHRNSNGGTEEEVQTECKFLVDLGLMIFHQNTYR